MATKYDLVKANKELLISIQQGETYFDTVSCLNSDGTPFDLTGCSIRSQLKTLDDVLKATFVCTVEEPLLGKIKRTISALDTALIDVVVPVTKVSHVWGVEITLSGGLDILPEIQGPALILPEIVK